MAGTNVIQPRELTGPAKTSGYRPSVLASPAWLGTGGFALGSFTLQVVDDMRRDPVVSLALSYKKAPLFEAKFEIQASNANVENYCIKSVERFWRKSLSVSLECMPYGYGGSECMLKEEDGQVMFDMLKPLHSRDCKPYTRGGKLAFVRVGHIVDANQTPEGVQDEHGYVDLLGARKDRPCEGYWSVYDGTYSPWYGRPLLIASWWYWRLKTMPDGALENLHKFFYKYGYNGMVGRYPDETYDDGSGTKHAQDFMRQLAEQVKAGAIICLPSERFENGEYKYIFERYGGETPGGAGDQAIGYVDWLDKGIVRGTLIPDEVITHDGNTGGYSRSQIAFLAFIIGEEQILGHQLEGFVDQVLRPGVTLNFGEGEKFTIKPLPLLKQDEMPQPSPESAQVPEGVPGADQPAGVRYAGPRGGQGVKDPATGKVVYGKSSVPGEPGLPFSISAQTEQELERLAKQVIEDVKAKRMSTVGDDCPKCGQKLVGHEDDEDKPVCPNEECDWDGAHEEDKLQTGTYGPGTAMSLGEQPAGHVTLHRGMSQEEYKRVKQSGIYHPNPNNPHNDATTDLETAKHYASDKVHEDPGVVIRFHAPHSHVKADDIYKGDYKVLKPIDVRHHEVVHGTPSDATSMSLRDAEFYLNLRKELREIMADEPLEMSAPFDESKHPRGQPKNKGEFASKPGGGGGGTATATKHQRPVAAPSKRMPDEVRA